MIRNESFNLEEICVSHMKFLHWEFSNALLDYPQYKSTIVPIQRLSQTAYRGVIKWQMLKYFIWMKEMEDDNVFFTFFEP